MDLLISAYADDEDNPLSDEEIIAKKKLSSPSRIRSRSRSPRKLSDAKDGSTKDGSPNKKSEKKESSPRKKSGSRSPSKKSAKDVSPSKKSAKDVSPSKKSAKDLSPSKKSAKDVSPSKKSAKDLSPSKKSAKDVSPSKKSAKDVSPSKKLAKDVSPSKKSAKDAASPKKTEKKDAAKADEEFDEFSLSGGESWADDDVAQVPKEENEGENEDDMELSGDSWADEEEEKLRLEKLAKLKRWKEQREARNQDGVKAMSSTQAKAKAQPKARVISDGINVAPDVDIIDPNTTPFDLTKKLVVNPKIGHIFNDESMKKLKAQKSSHHMGHVEQHDMSNFDFDNQFNSFNTYGSGYIPANNQIKRAIQATVDEDNIGKSVYDGVVKDKRKRLKADDPSKLDGYLGPWAGFAGEKEKNEEARVKAHERFLELERKKEEEAKAKEGAVLDLPREKVTSIFHAKKEIDYQGRSWIKPKNHDDKKYNPDIKNFLPKKWIHSFEGHEMGVNAVRFFPETAHLLLSCSMDSKIKIWDFGNQRKCLRTYMGHDQAVRDIQFAENGAKFYSASYDKNVNLWDTETGQVIRTFTNKKIPFCVTVHPDADKQNRIITGCSNKKAVEYDATSGQVVQEYDEHLGSVNSVTFVDNARRIVTTSDDKKIFIWEYGIPVVSKYISEPTLHSVPTVTMHPSGDFFCGQSMNNKIVTYEASGRFKYQPQRVFRGHTCSGHACQINFSPDGRFIMSGDNDGKLFFWDWAKGKNYRVLKAHDQVCIGTAWHPKQASKVVTCGWDGLIKLWD